MANLEDFFINTELSRKQEGDVIYWMIRDFRVKDNRGLYFAYKEALKRGVKLKVLIVIRGDLRVKKMSFRTLRFWFDGISEVAMELGKKGVELELLVGDPVKVLIQKVKKEKVGLVVNDFFPLRVYRRWQEELLKEKIPLLIIDSHNLIPVTKVSDKQEYGAYTIRKKILDKLIEYVELPRYEIRKSQNRIKAAEVEKLFFKIKVDDIYTKTLRKGGEKEALNTLDRFVRSRLVDYAEKRSDPCETTSELSAYIHFGMISVAEVVRRVMASKTELRNKEAFIEELVVRRELAENFCFYNRKYDSKEGLPSWARESIDKHRNDKRETYSLEELLKAKTKDSYWNAAQEQLIQTGYMHGYMRMYWAKKVLEWSSSLEEAIDRLIHINDLLEIDGRDPNGYVGILWAVGGLHDRPFVERNIFGKVRYMNDKGLKRKFRMELYVDRFLGK